MANFNELERLGERFPNKNVGCGNPSAKILVVTQNAEDYKVIKEYLNQLFEEYFNMDENIHMITIIYDEKVLTSLHLDHYQVVLYTFTDGNYLQEHDPTKMFGMQWLSGCTVEDGAIQRLFVAHSEAEGDKPERIMFCTYPFREVSCVIQKCTKLLLYWFLYT